jgi:two-component system response regulator HydG
VIEPARILVIDDDEGIRASLSMILQHAGYLVDNAENGKQAIEKTSENFYNLALIDIRLPDMEGTELLSSLKETTPKMVKIILTGYPAMNNAVTAVNKGADAYLIKPVNTDELLTVVKDRLAKQAGAIEYDQNKIAQFIETRLNQLKTQDRSSD